MMNSSFFWWLSTSESSSASFLCWGAFGWICIICRLIWAFSCYWPVSGGDCGLIFSRVRERSWRRILVISSDSVAGTSDTISVIAIGCVIWRRSSYERSSGSRTSLDLDKFSTELSGRMGPTVIKSDSTNLILNCPSGIRANYFWFPCRRIFLCVRDVLTGDYLFFISS